MQELINLVDQLIIDNNTNQVTPAKLRQVLIAMITQMYSSGAGGVPTITANNPLAYDGFTGTLDVLPVPFGAMRWIAKGYKWDSDPSGDSANENDYSPEGGDFFLGTDLDGNFYITRWDGVGEKENVENHIIAAQWKVRSPGETQEED